ncbi:IS630 family transposase [Chroogloeocystis siderophila 5.2 s.c.1]|jgi:transposase|uniref:IS630 family transposase n=1 Tax=Chroogloeocystis siderophila 5.2 s.c.1 TaxID=247279 RepID=A0A1U7HS51_9CHRO|nr:IS630 family transposase [Chroogloeocystis siderophila 5.2 s.c.1]
MAIKYTVNLTQEEHQQLVDLTKKGKNSARVLKRAQILLLADQGYQDEVIASMLMVGESTVHRTRQRYVEEGVELALSERPRKGREKKLNPQAEAFLIATACSNPPSGRESWTMQLLAAQLVSLELMDRISDETVRTTLKKTKSNLG